MSKIWANRILAGTKFYSQVPAKYKAEVKSILESSNLTNEELAEILSQ